MPEEFEGRDLTEAVFWGVDLKRAYFRDVDLTGVRVFHALLQEVEIDGVVDRLVINGVDVTQYVNEHDSWYPLRSMLRPPDPEGMRSTWTALEQAWAATIERAGRLPEPLLYESVDGEWSFVDTLRHLVFAIDKWFTAPILGVADFGPLGIPNSGSADFGWPGIDRAMTPTFDEALVAGAELAARFGNFLESLAAGDLATEVEVLENGVVPLAECVYTVFEEVFEHNRYALRDLAMLEATAGGT